MRDTWFRISSRYLVFIFDLKNKEVQNAIPIYFLFPKAADIYSPNLFVTLVFELITSGKGK